jgi:hypothetical protein
MRERPPARSDTLAAMKRTSLLVAAAALLLALAGLVYLLLTPAAAPPVTAAALPGAPASAAPAAPEQPEPGERPAPDDAPAAPRPHLPGTRTVFGTVRNPAGEPLAGVTVRIAVERAPDRTTRTAADGAFTLDGVPPRAARLEFSARGYETRRFDRPNFPDAPRVRWDVTLKPAAGVHGVVLVGDDPVADAWVELRARAGARLASARSDGSGRFALETADAGPFTVAAMHGQYGRAQIEVAGPGEVTIQLPGGGFVEGQVVDPEGDPVQAFTVTASTLDRGMGGPPAQSFESGDGRFRLGPLAPGLLEVWAVAEGYQPGEAKRVRIDPGQTQSGVVLKLRRSATLTGRVTDARTGRPIAGASVVPAEWSSGALAESVGALTDGDGRYTLKSLPGQRTSIDVRAEGYRPLLVGGVVGAPGATVVRNFSLSPQRRDQVPATELTGIGAVLAPHPAGVAFRQIIDGGPAAQSLHAGDVVVMVDGQRLAPGDLGKAAQAIRGEIGTDVEMWVLRGGQGEPERVVLRRDRVVLPDPHHPRGDGND